jgi:hypothetical protein
MKHGAIGKPEGGYAVKVTSTDARSFRLGAATLGLALALSPVAALSQGMPASCVTELRKEYSTSSALKTECANDTDCTFQAPEGNASALALIGAMVKKVEACFTAAGLAVVKEDAMAGGTTRQYGKSGGSEMCAVLIATGSGGLASGLRATCQPAG